MEGFKQQHAQLSLLIKKNLKVGIRGWYSTLILLLVPALLVFLFWVMQQTLYYPQLTTDTRTLDVTQIPKCRSMIDPDGLCITVAYAPNNEKTWQLMKIVAEIHNLSIANDYLDTSLTYDIVAFTNRTAISDYIGVHPNSTQALVLFSYLDTSDYEIVTQSSWRDEFFQQALDDADCSLQMKVAMDQALLTQKLRAVENDASLVFELNAKRQVVQGANNYLYLRSVMWSTFGMLFLYIGMIIYAFNLSSTIHEERTLHLVHGLKIAGMLNGPFWMSWFLTYALYSLIASVLVVVVGLATQLSFFVYCNFIIAVLSIWLGYLATIAFTLWLSSWIHRPVVNSLLLTFFVLIQGGMVWLYGWSLMVVATMYDSGGLIPSLLIYSCSFGSLFAQINALTVGFDAGGNVIEPKGFTWANLYEDQYGLRDSVVTSSTLMLYLLLNIVVGLFFAWHFDYVWPGQYGVPKRLFFFCTPTFWGLSPSESIVDISAFDASKINSVVSDLDPHINAENEFAVRAAKRGDPDVLLKVLRLSKTFKKGRSANAQDARALDMVSLAGVKNSILCILGHNGAGKTTLLNLLTGVFAPSYGEAFIGSSSITDNIDKIRSMIGVCAQEDVLWPRLTAREHLELFATLKGVPGDRINDEVNKRLEQVSLTSAANRLAVTFSGGMKRRLSVAISSLGNPTVIFLDEPTTGLDPSNKRQLWDVIEEMKKDRLIVLTTHSMAEADHLGDKIAILALGRMRAIGNSLHLKSQFGVGYHLNLVCNEPEDVHVAKNKMNEFFPMATLETESANNLSYSITQLRVEQLSPFLSWIENEGALERKGNNLNAKAILLDWSLSQTTLEEVFLRVTHGNASLHGENGDQTEAHSAPVARDLKVVLGEDYGNPIGEISIDASTTAHECREFIEKQPAIASRLEGYTYNILFNGVPLKLSEEHSTKAIDFLPLMALELIKRDRPVAQVSMKQHTELIQRYEVLLNQQAQLLKEMEVLKQTAVKYEKLQLEYEELRSKLAEIEKNL